MTIDSDIQDTKDHVEAKITEELRRLICRQVVDDRGLIPRSNTRALFGEALVNAAEQHGTFQDQLAEGFYRGAVTPSLHDRIMATAKAALTPRQLQVFCLHLEGQGPREIARSMGLHHSSVQALLFGRRNHNRNGGRMGAINKVKAKLETDPAFVEEAATAIDNSGIHESTWFAASRLKPELFGPLAVLLVAHKAADLKREVSFNDLVQLMSRVHLEAGLQYLRSQNYILWDGFKVRILKTPIDVKPAEVTE